MLELAEATDVWRALPAEIAGTLRMEAGLSITEMIEAISSESGYSPPLDTSYTASSAAPCGIRSSSSSTGSPIRRPPSPRSWPSSAAIGFVEAREGRSLEPLQNAMRLGARVAWRWLCAVAGEPGLDMQVLGRIGEAIFVYLDELARRVGPRLPGGAAPRSRASATGIAGGCST